VPAQEFNLSREKGIGDFSFMKTISQSWWSVGKGSLQSVARRQAPDLVEPVAKIQTKLLE
jgi:hypothetical protein